MLQRRLIFNNRATRVSLEFLDISDVRLMLLLQVALHPSDLVEKGVVNLLESAHHSTIELITPVSQLLIYKLLLLSKLAANNTAYLRLDVVVAATTHAHLGCGC